MTAVMYGGAPDPFNPSPRDPFAPQPFVLVPNPWPVVMPPPPYAADDESAALNAMLKLDDEARRRVMRYLMSRYGEVKP